MVKIVDLRPGMEHMDIRVTLKALNEPREVLTNYGITHNLVDGVVMDDSGSVGITFWNEKIELLKGIDTGSRVELRDCFVTSFKGDLSINVGRDSTLEKIK
ncbi:MAG: OB-fold nucleic acid binding domain-containing protein [Candidatus Bathyarchaeota archaeon]|jgi:replication factor A1|nr:OB-fold nucleic acid binding domain-containing protein [Candidatus Bathyarchaeota archaeon]